MSGIWRLAIAREHSFKSSQISDNMEAAGLIVSSTHVIQQVNLYHHLQNSRSASSLLTCDKRQIISQHESNQAR